jgi:hypothetical protein
VRGYGRAGVLRRGDAALSGLPRRRGGGLEVGEEGVEGAAEAGGGDGPIRAQEGWKDAEVSVVIGTPSR